MSQDGAKDWPSAYLLEPRGCDGRAAMDRGVARDRGAGAAGRRGAAEEGREARAGGAKNAGAVGHPSADAAVMGPA
eukprot:scaffold135718_cov35-Prasinocladus_malaysianus.AAC.2